LIKQKIYSPHQVLAGSLLGGPMAMVYLLWKNFQVLENPHGMRQILLWGSIFIVTMVGFAPLLPTNWPGYALPILYSVGAWSLAESFQMSKQAIGDSQDYEFQSVWNVIGVSIAFLFAMVVFTLVLFLGLAAIGLI
jgi:lipid-A-disaccharide synthase-like uncharacterized protein